MSERQPTGSSPQDFDRVVNVTSDAAGDYYDVDFPTGERYQPPSPPSHLREVSALPVDGRGYPGSDIETNVRADRYARERQAIDESRAGPAAFRGNVEPQ